MSPMLAAILASAWPLVDLVEKRKYVGIIYGRFVTPELLYEGPLEKALDRLRLFSPVMKRLDPQAKIITCNVFITPLFSFIEQFYVMPDLTYHKYRMALHAAITPFHRGGWPYSQLVAPFKKGGFKQPLRDPWVNNSSALFKHTDFKSINIEADLPWSLDRTMPANSLPLEYVSPRIQDHIKLALMEFLGPLYLNWDGVTKLHLTKEKIHEVLLHCGSILYPASGYCKKRKVHGRDHLHHLAKRYSKFESKASSMTLAHYALLSSSIPAFLVTHNIKCLCNALNTDSRRCFFDPASCSHVRKSPTLVRPCYLCSKETDQTSHIYCSCGVVKAALKLVFASPLCPKDSKWSAILVKKSTPLFILDFDSLLPS